MVRCEVTAIRVPALDQHRLVSRELRIVAPREIWGDMGRYREMWGDVGRCGKVQGGELVEERLQPRHLRAVPRTRAVGLLPHALALELDLLRVRARVRARVRWLGLGG